MRRKPLLLVLTTATIALNQPADATWVRNTPTVAKYVNRIAPVGGDIKVAIIKPGSLLKVVAKGLGDVPLDVSMAPVGPVHVTESVVNDGQEYRHCTSFTNCTHRSIAGGTGYKLVCSDGASGGPACLPTDIPVTGLKLIVTDSLVATGKARVVFVAKDAAVTSGTPAFGPGIEANFDVAYDSVSGTFHMPRTPNCPTPPCVSGCFEDWGQTIQDTCTNLQWEKKDGVDGEFPGAGTSVPSNLHDVDNRYSWAGLCTLNSSVICQPNAAAAAACIAQAGGVLGCAECGAGDSCDPTAFGGITTIWDWIGQVNAESFGGHSDWRLATVAGSVSNPTGQPAELESIFDLSAGICGDPGSTDQCIDPIFFPNGGSASYWSGSSFTDPGFAWRMDFASDDVLGHPPLSQKGKGAGQYVRAVRSNP